MAARCSNKTNAGRPLPLLLQIVRTSVHEISAPENLDLVRSILVEGGLCEKIVEAFEGECTPIKLSAWTHTHSSPIKLSTARLT